MLRYRRGSSNVLTLILIFCLIVGISSYSVVNSQTISENFPVITIDNANQLVEIASCSLQHLTGQIAWSPDGKYLAIASSSGAQLLELDSFCVSEVVTLKTNAELRSISFSLDGTLLVGGDAEGNAYVWEMDTHKETLQLQT